jgi:hypothetical protein
MNEHTHDHDHEQGDDKEKEVEQLKHWLEHFARIYKFATFRKERCEELMRRRSAKKWKPEKVARMARRLMTANKEIEQSESALDQCTHRLSQLGVEVDIVSRASESTRAA